MAIDLNMLWLLVRLRYKLIWANVRTSSGKVVVVFCLYLLGLLVAAFFVLGGLGAAVIAVKAGKAETVARAVLAALFAFCTGVSLFLGVGPSSAMSDSALRAFPLQARWRFLFRHMVAALDPVWLFLLVAAMGMALGFQLLGVSPILLGLPVAVVFTFVCYLWAAALLALVGKILQFRSGALILMVAVMSVLFGLEFAPHGRWIHSPLLLAAINKAINLSPAGSCAAALAGSGWMVRLGGVVVLLICGIAGGAALRLAEEFRFRSTRRKAANASSFDLYDRVAVMLSPRLAPLVAKSLRYHLRCNRVRYALLSTPVFVLLLAITQNRSQEFKGSMLLIILFITCFFSTAIMAVNHFGWDGNGVARYPLLPVPMVDVLRAHVIASMTLGSVPTLLVLGAVLWFSRGLLSAQLVIFAFANSVAGAFFFFSVGAWLSVLAPLRVNFDSMMGNAMSRLSQFTIIIGAVALMFTLHALVGDTGELARWWWGMALFAVLMYFIFEFSLRMLTPVLERRREKLIGSIAGVPVS